MPSPPRVERVTEAELKVGIYNISKIALMFIEKQRALIGRELRSLSL